MRNHRAARSLLVVLVFALAVFFADSGVANARPSAQACKAAAVAQQNCQGADAPAAPCAKHASASQTKKCEAGAASKCAQSCCVTQKKACCASKKAECAKACAGSCASGCKQACAEACAKICGSSCDAKCKKAFAEACAKACADKCKQACAGSAGVKCASACSGACVAGCKQGRAVVCGPRCRSACRGAASCDCGKVSCRLYGLACGKARQAKAGKWAKARCQQPCCARVSKCAPGCSKPCCAGVGAKAYRKQLSVCGPDCTKPCCAPPCKTKKAFKISKCKPGCNKACCAPPQKKLKVVRGGKCGPGCTKACCAPPGKPKRAFKVSECKPGCQKACCASPKKIQENVWVQRSGLCAKNADAHQTVKVDCHMEDRDGEEVCVINLGHGDEHVWVEASGEGLGEHFEHVLQSLGCHFESGDGEGTCVIRGDNGVEHICLEALAGDWKDRDCKVKKIRIKSSDDPEVREIIIDDDGVRYGDDPKDIHFMMAGGEKIAWLGVRLQDLTDELREAFDLPADVQGALITDVDRSGPARKSGVRKGFVVVEFDGVPIESADDLIKAVRASEPGDQISLVMNRKGSLITRRVTLGSRMAEVDIHRDFDSEVPDIRIEMPEVDELIDIKRLAKGKGGYLGVSAEALSEREREKLGLPEDMGVEINQVHEGTAADDAGLEEGDVIVKVDDEGIEDIDDLVDAISSREPGDEVTLFLMRDGEKMKMDVELGERELPETIKLARPWKMRIERGDRLEMRREALKKQLMQLHKRLQKLEDELEEIDEKIEEEEEN